MPDLPDYAKDDHHDRLLFRLIAGDGSVIQTAHCAAPLNKDPRIPVRLEILIAHEDGCARVLQAHPLGVY